MDVQTATVVITGISVIIGVILSLNSRRQELETRQAQLFMQVYDRWSSRESVKAYGLLRYKYQWSDLADWSTKYHPEVNIDGYADFMTFNAFFEGLGVLVKKGLIDIGLVEDLFSQRILWFWENVHVPTVDDTRKITDDPTQYDCCWHSEFN